MTASGTSSIMIEKVSHRFARTIQEKTRPNLTCIRRKYCCSWVDAQVVLR